MTPSPMNDASLVVMCLKGERHAYDDLVRKYQKAAYGLAFSYVRNEQDAADLTQDAFIKGYLRLDSLKEPSRFGPWLKTIVANDAKRSSARRKARRTLAMETAAIELDRQAAENFPLHRTKREL